MRAQFSKDPLTDRALRHSIRDGMAFSVQVGAGETYFSAFALFLRASAPQIALLATLPPLLGSLAQLLSAWLGRFTGRRLLVLAGAGLQAALWLPILAVPQLFPELAVAALLVLLALYHSAANLAAPQWTSIMRDLVSERRRGRYFGHRTRLTTITTFVALVAGGLVLHALDADGRTYQGFAAIFAVAFVARAISVYHLAFLHDPPAGTPPPDLHVTTWWRSLKETGTLGFSLYYALMNAAVGISAPLFTVYMLRDLALNYFEFMVLTGASVFVQFLTLTTWGRIADVYGNRLILILTSMSLPVVPTLWLVSDNFAYLVFVQCASGLTWAGFTLAAGNLLYDLVPRTRRAAYVAFHNVGTAAGVFCGAMIGAALVVVLPPVGVLVGDDPTRSNLLLIFVISGVSRAIIAALGVRRVRELRKPRRSLSPQSFVMRITGVSAMLGVLYDFIGRPPAETADAPEPGRTDAAERGEKSPRDASVDA